jgi:SRSO17 transposase
MHQARRLGPPPDVITVCEKELMGLLSEVKGFLDPYLSLFHRVDMAEIASEYVQGLMSKLPRKSAEPMSELFDEDRKVFQRFVGDSPWSDKAVREKLAADVTQTIGDPTGVICLDPSAFPKKGRMSVGVGRMWCGRMGKIDNCQIGVFASYVSRKGRTLLDTQLFLPEEWVDDPEAREKCRVPEDRRYLNHWELADEVLLNVSKVPHACVLADSEMGRCGEWRDRLAERGEKYVLDIPSNLKVHILDHGGLDGKSVQVSAWVKSRPKSAWIRVQTRDGSTGPMTFAIYSIEVETVRKNKTRRRETLLGLYPLDNPSDLRLMLTNLPKDTPIEEVAQYATRRWTIEDCFQRAKGECGMGHYEVRSWPGWHHHMTMSILASWLLEKIRLTRGEAFPPSDLPTVRTHSGGNHLKPQGRSESSGEKGFAKAQQDTPGNLLSPENQKEVLSRPGNC